MTKYIEVAYYNPYRDEINSLNYVALYIAIIGYIPKGKSKREYYDTKTALNMAGIKTEGDVKIAK